VFVGHDRKFPANDNLIFKFSNSLPSVLVKTKAIVISAIRYQEKSLIVRCFTESDGIKSYFVRSAFSSGKSSSKSAYFQPLTMLEIEASHKNKGTLETFKEVRLARGFDTLTTDIIKTTIGLFLSEMMHNSIREEAPNPKLFTFLETSLEWLDHHESVSNFHLIFLLQMTRYLGFYPHEGPGNWFDMTEGFFTEHPSSACLDDYETTLLRRLMAMRYQDENLAFSVNQRQTLLRILIDYYALHLEGFHKPKSLDVLRDIFAE
jgi:DNA repair protein RecO (recombination protein O)